MGLDFPNALSDESDNCHLMGHTLPCHPWSWELGPIAQQPTLLDMGCCYTCNDPWHQPQHETWLAVSKVKTIKCS